MRQSVKHWIFLVVIIIGGCETVYAQSISREVIATAGKENRSANVILFSNVGEISVEAQISPSAILTEGFEQPDAFVSTSINTLSHADDLFYIYPNPAANEVTILYKNNTGFKFTVHSLAGESLMVEPQTSFDSKLTFDISTWATGVYFVEFFEPETNNVLAIYKLIKL